MTNRVLAIAHRAGNEVHLLHEALEVGADMAEADIWPYRGRLEVRHLKTAGPVPVLWDRWKLASAWAPRLLIADLLSNVPPGIGLMLDLKGHNLAGAREIAGLAGYLAYEHRLYVCARDWAMLEPFRDSDAYVVHSAGTAREVTRLLPLLESGAVRHVSLHQKLLTPVFVARLRQHAHTLMTWPVNDIARMQELVSWGVNGITTDSLEVVRAIRAGHG